MKFLFAKYKSLNNCYGSFQFINEQSYIKDMRCQNFTCFMLQYFSGKTFKSSMKLFYAEILTVAL